MATASLSREFDHDADTIWNVVGSFERYEWGAGVEPGVIEDGRPDNEIGSVRAFRYYGEPARQRLTARRPGQRTYSWESLEPFEDIEHYVQTIEVQPLDDHRSQMNWTADFDAPDVSVERWSAFFRDEFAKGFDELGGILDRNGWE